MRNGVSKNNQEMRRAVEAKLLELDGSEGFVDNELFDYLTVMPENKYSKQQMMEAILPARNKIKKDGEKTMWTDEYTTALLDLWEDNLLLLKGSENNTRIYERMAREMRNVGMILTGREVKNKLSNMARKYRHEKRKVAPSGKSLKRWEYFTRVHNIIEENTPNNLDEVMLVSTDFSQFLVENEANSDNSSRPSVSPVESETESTTERRPPKKQKHNNDREQGFRDEMMQLSRERTAAMQQLVASNIRLEKRICSFIARLEGQIARAEK